MGAYWALRWLAPAWAIGGLLGSSAATAHGLLSMLGRTLVSAALYLYIATLCAPPTLRPYCGQRDVDRLLNPQLAQVDQVQQCKSCVAGATCVV